MEYKAQEKNISPGNYQCPSNAGLHLQTLLKIVLVKTKDTGKAAHLTFPKQENNGQKHFTKDTWKGHGEP